MPNTKVSNFSKKLKKIGIVLSLESYTKTYGFYLTRLSPSTAHLVERLHSIAISMMLLFLPFIRSSSISRRLIEAYCVTRVLSDVEIHKLKKYFKDDSTLRQLVKDRKIKEMLTDNPTSQSSLIGPDFKFQNIDEFNKQLDELGLIWNTGHKLYTRQLTEFKRSLELLDYDKTKIHKRYLPHFTSNYGHLGFLFLYLNYYRKEDSSRIVFLPDRLSANSFLLKKIINESPIQIKLVNDLMAQKFSLSNVDTLSFSRTSSGFYRTESSSASGCDQEFPEYSIETDFVLKLSDDENKVGYEKLSRLLGREITWFALLHIRGPRNDVVRFSQSRDASVSGYNLLCEQVKNSGGLVIRNGEPDFCHLPEDFLAFDYAHSEIKSPFMDFWLNANCAFWVGNMNGASVVPIAFGKPRLVTDAWFIDNNGPSYDHYATKSLFKKGERLSDEEVMDSSIGRVMNRKWLKYHDYDLKELTSVQLAEVCSEFLEFAKKQKLLREPLTGVDSDLLNRYKSLPNKMTKIQSSF